MIHREFILQKHLRLFVREALACEHEFFAHDRGKPAGRFTHLREKMRGIQKATPDTQLIVLGKHIWCEVKQPGKAPTADQEAMGERLKRLGDGWFWTTSVELYRYGLRRYGVPMRPSAEFLALHHDGLVASEIAKAEAKAGIVPKRRKVLAPRPTARKVARVRATGVWTP